MHLTLEVVPLGLPVPKRRETYHSFVSRCHRYVKRNPTAVRGIYTGRGKNKKLNLPALTKKIATAWKRRAKTKRGN